METYEKIKAARKQKVAEKKAREASLATKIVKHFGGKFIGEPLMSAVAVLDVATEKKRETVARKFSEWTELPDEE